MARYLLIVDFQSGPDESPMEQWAHDEVTAHLDYYNRLTPSSTPGRAGRRDGPDRARPRQDRHVRRHDPRGDRRSVPGVQGVDRRLPDRRRRVRGPRARIAALVSAVPGRGGVPTAAADPGPPVMDDGAGGCGRDGRFLETAGTPSRTSPAHCRGPAARLAPQVLGALARRRVTSTRPRTPSRRPYRRGAALAADGIPRTRAGGSCRRRRRKVDRWRSEAARARPGGPLTAEPVTGDACEEDDTLAVLFLRCHPALTPARRSP